MTERTTQALQGVLVGLAGLVVAFLASTGAYGVYLKPAMRFPLLAAGLLMLVLGAATVAHAAASAPSNDAGRDDDDPEHGAEHGHGHDHAHGVPRVAWLLALPLLAAVLLRPPALGADAVRRDGRTAPVAADATSTDFGPLPAPRDGAVDMTHSEFVRRARFDEDRGLDGAPVRLIGFVVSEPGVDDGYLLTRFVMACCAGDALPISVRVSGLDDPPPPDDTWVEAVVEWVPPSGDDPEGRAVDVVVRVLDQTEIAPPTFPYE